MGAKDEKEGKTHEMALLKKHIASLHRSIAVLAQDKQNTRIAALPSVSWSEHTELAEITTTVDNVVSTTLVRQMPKAAQAVMSVISSLETALKVPDEVKGEVGGHYHTFVQKLAADASRTDRRALLNHLHPSYFPAPGDALKAIANIVPLHEGPTLTPSGDFGRSETYAGNAT